MYTHAPARDTRHAGKYTRTHYRGAAHRENTGEVLQRAGEYHGKTPGAHQIRTRPRETPARREPLQRPLRPRALHRGSVTHITPGVEHHAPRTIEHTFETRPQKRPPDTGGARGSVPPPYQGLFPGIFRNLTE